MRRSRRTAPKPNARPPDDPSGPTGRAAWDSPLSLRSLAQHLPNLQKLAPAAPAAKPAATSAAKPAPVGSFEAKAESKVSVDLGTDHLGVNGDASVSVGGGGYGASFEVSRSHDQAEGSAHS